MHMSIALKIAARHEAWADRCGAAEFATDPRRAELATQEERSVEQYWAGKEQVRFTKELIALSLNALAESRALLSRSDTGPNKLPQTWKRSNARLRRASSSTGTL